VTGSSRQGFVCVNSSSQGVCLVEGNWSQMGETHTFNMQDHSRAVQAYANSTLIWSSLCLQQQTEGVHACRPHPDGSTAANAGLHGCRPLHSPPAHPPV
jgi:hypothetical protein